MLYSLRCFVPFSAIMSQFTSYFHFVIFLLFLFRSCCRRSRLFVCSDWLRAHEKQHSHTIIPIKHYRIHAEGQCDTILFTAVDGTVCAAHMEYYNVKPSLCTNLACDAANIEPRTVAFPFCVPSSPWILTCCVTVCGFECAQHSHSLALNLINDSLLMICYLSCSRKAKKGLIQTHAHKRLNKSTNKI